MKNIFSVLLVGLFLIDTTGLWAEDKKVEITGFIDTTYQKQQKQDTLFDMNAFEIDFASEFSEKVSWEGAVVVEDGEVSLGQTMVDIKLLGEEKLGLQAGLLDMPFGLDYQVFATPDRKMVTPPLITEQMMDGGWGDIGVNLHGSLSIASQVNYNLYVVNGLGYDSGADDVYGTADDVGYVCQLADNNNAKTLGARLGFLPIKDKDLEIGLSYARGPYLFDNTTDILSRNGGDIQFSYRSLKVKGEYIYGKEKIPAASSRRHSGYYLQLLSEIKGLSGNLPEEIYGAVRYGGWRPQGGEKENRLTTTLGYDFIENVSFRLEYQINRERPKETNNLLSCQMVIRF